MVTQMWLCLMMKTMLNQALRDITSGLDIIAKVKTKMTRDSNGFINLTKAS